MSPQHAAARHAASYTPHHSRPGGADDASARDDAPHFIANSPAMAAALRDAELLAPHEQACVLIEGETGTGKSYLARHLHLKSPRGRQTFHQVTLSAIDDTLASSDLFGHIRGSYTDARQDRAGHFVTANRGTLFLDEIGKASPAVQRKLLHAIEHREVMPVGADRVMRLDVRLVAATNIPLAEQVASGSFLDDLAARLLPFRVKLPALRERRDDIPQLVRQFLRLRAPQFGHPLRVPDVEPDLMAALQRADWPHNLRQLDGVVQRLLMYAVDEPTLGLRHCTGDLAPLCDGRSVGLRITPDLVRERLEELGSKIETARSLGVSRWTVDRYLGRATGNANGGPTAPPAAPAAAPGPAGSA